MDIFTMHVEHTEGEGMFCTEPVVTMVRVMAPSENEATLTALEMVAARGRCPVAVDVDYSNF